MAIHYVEGKDIFETPCDTITITTNTVGVMGAGLALEARKRFPGVWPHYRFLCQNGIHQIRKPDLWVDPEGEKKLLLFPTKRHWRYPSQVDWIAGGLEHLRQEYRSFPYDQIKSLAMVPLGCGLGGLDWAGTVKPLIEHYLGDLEIDVYVYE